MGIYLDNAATSFPKPDVVYSSIINYMKDMGGSYGRGSSSKSLEASRIVFNCRSKICNLFNFDKPENVIFTPNITLALNMLLKGIIKDNWHIITTSMDHNSVLRPLNSIKQHKNIEIDIIQCDNKGLINIEDIKLHIKKNTKLIVLSHASNIVGNIQPIEAIGKLCKDNNIYFIVDSAQTAGLIPIDFYKNNCSALAFTGHKSLLGPQGTGGFLIDDKLNEETCTILEGGTGSLSESTVQPDFLPDKFEFGTMNIGGINGLLEAINFINSIGLDSIHEKEMCLFNYFVDKLMNINNLKIHGFDADCKKTPVISLTSDKISNEELSFLLDNEFGITTRAGLHCAPLAHKTIGTYPSGTIRFSLGYFNTLEDIEYTIDSLYKIIKRMC